MVLVAIVCLDLFLLPDAPSQLVAHGCGEWWLIRGGRYLAGQWVDNIKDSQPGQTGLRTWMGGLCRWRRVPKVTVNGWYWENLSELAGEVCCALRLTEFY